MQPVNFRDVGEALGLWMDPSPVRQGRLHRGGAFDALARLEDLGSPRTILNLRRGPDPSHVGATIAHVPAPDDLENYHTQNRRVAEWVRRAVQVLASPDTRWPVYVHCTSGRDRTGVVVAACLLVVGVPRDVVVGEYSLSTGAKPDLIESALDGLGAFSVGAASRAVLVRELGGPA